MIESELNPQLQSPCSELWLLQLTKYTLQSFYNENKLFQPVSRVFTELEDRHIWPIFKNKCQKQHFITSDFITNMWYSVSYLGITYTTHFYKQNHEVGLYWGIDVEVTPKYASWLYCLVVGMVIHCSVSFAFKTWK